MTSPLNRCQISAASGLVRRGPERCFLLGDLLPLIMVQDERFILIFPCEKEGLEFQDISEDTGGLVVLSGFLFYLNSLYSS